MGGAVRSISCRPLTESRSIVVMLQERTIADRLDRQLTIASRRALGDSARRNAEHESSNPLYASRRGNKS